MTTIISFIIVLLILIFVHEAGHFLAAKLLGVKVERFSLGFPPKAWSRTIGETEYQLAWLPLGGYVKMYGEDPAAEEEVSPELRHRSFSHKPAWAKSLIVLAGPVFNLLFAGALLSAVFLAAGRPHLAPVLGPVAPGSPAGLAGLAMDDLVTGIDGRPVRYFDELDAAVRASRGRPLEVSFERRGRLETVWATPAPAPRTDEYGEVSQVYSLGVSARLQPVIGQVLPGRPAALAGLRAGDRIVTIDGRATPDWQDVLLAIQGPPDRRLAETLPPPSSLAVQVERDGRLLTRAVTPAPEPSLQADGRTVYRAMIGLEVEMQTVDETLGPAGSVRAGFTAAADLTGRLVKAVVKLVRGEVSIKTLGGPILIAQETGRRARAGWIPLLELAAFISLNLGILNLLPIPVLDGGQLVFFTIEGLLRRPVSQRLRAAGQGLGLFLLGLLMVTVFYNDLARLFTPPPSPQMEERTEDRP